ncbi:DUF2273 domain-containing protein [Marinococcus halotolerans]|uniref:DUF2273 domain-containing protein n=1 Tax=Marinococcus halotolerans TaxID=301092 RepID=UPI0003B51EAB|nr:DUF2273 domain-containing protein [Marinococcus halotolerans]
MNEETWQRLRPYRGRIISLLMAIVFSILYLTVGFGHALVVLLFLLIGVLIGKIIDGDLRLDQLLAFFFQR